MISRLRTLVARAVLSLALVGGVGAFIAIPGGRAASDPLAKAEELLARNRLRDAAREFGRVAEDPDLPADVRARAWRGRGIASQGRMEHTETLLSFARSVALDPRHPASVIVAQQLLELMDDDGLPEGWDRVAQAMDSATVGLGEVRTAVLRARAEARSIAGRFEEADSLSSSIAWIRDYLVIGPFDNAGGSGIDEPYPPESRIDAKMTCADRRGRSAVWMPATTRPNGYVDLDMLLDDEIDALSYSLTHVRSDEPREAIAVIVAFGSVRLWANGELVLDEPEYHASAAGSFEVPIRLRAGWNRLLLKLGAEQMRAGFRLRLTDTDGHPLRLETRAEPPSEIAAGGAEAGVGGGASTLRGLGRFPEHGWLRQLAGAADVAPLEDVYMYIEALLERDLLDEADAAIRSAAERFPESALLTLLRADFLDAQGMARFEESEESEGIRRKAVEAAPELVEPWAAIAMQLLNQGEVDSAGVVVAKIAREFQASPLIQALHGTLQVNRGEITAGLEQVQQARDAAPGSIAIWDIYLETLQRQEMDAREKEELAAAIAARPDHDDWLRSAAADALEERRYDDALAQLDLALRTGSRAETIHLEKAVVLEAAGRADEAIAMLQAALRESPRSAIGMQRLGMLLLRSNRRDEAIPILRRTIENSPEDHETRELLRQVEGKPPLMDYFPKDDGKELAQADVSWSDPDARAIQLLDEENYIVHPDGAWEGRNHVVVKVLTSGGVEAYRRIELPAPNPPSSDIEIARSIKPDGREIEAEKEYGTVVFNDLAPGDLIEYRCVVRRGPTPGLAGSFWQSHFFQASDPCLVSRFAILLPSGREYDHRLHNLNLAPHRKNLGEWRLDVWEVRQCAADKPELGAPPVRERVAWLDIGNVPSWDEIVNWFDSAARGRTRSTQRIRALAQELGAGAATDSARIGRVVDHVRKSIRYEGGLFSQSAYIPRPADDVLRKKYGDCKDQAGLLIALLREMGIEAKFALVNSSNVTTVPYLPSPRFTHAVVRAKTGEGKIFWIDPTAQDISFPNVPVLLEGAQALVIDPQKPGFVKVDEDPAALNGSAGVGEGTVDAEGTLELAVRATYWGEDGMYLRMVTRLAASRMQEAIEKAVLSNQPGGSVSQIEYDTSGDLSHPYFLRYHIARPNAATFAGDLLILPVPWTIATAPKSDVAGEKRNHPLVLSDQKGVYREEIRLRLPEGYQPVSEPAPVDLVCPIGSFHLKRTWANGRDLTLERSLQIDSVRVAPEQYVAFRDFVNAASKAENEQLVLRKR